MQQSAGGLVQRERVSYATPMPKTKTKKQCGFLLMGPAGYRACTRPYAHKGKCRHLAARVVRGPQLALPVVKSSKGETFAEYIAKESGSKSRTVAGPLPKPRPLPSAPASSAKGRGRVKLGPLAEAALADKRAKERATLDEGATYRQQLVNCRKERCLKCKSGPSHGPYWYKVKRKPAGGFISKYVGKTLPRAILEHVARNGAPDAAVAAQAQLAASS